MSLTLLLCQNLVALVEDLNVCSKNVYFWNWRKDAFHLVIRYKRGLYELFKFGSSLEDILTQTIKHNEEQQQLEDVTTDS